jgi:hypothetical protein
MHFGMVVMELQQPFWAQCVYLQWFIMVFMSTVTRSWLIVHSLALGVGVGGEEQKVDKIPLFSIPWLVLSIVILFVGIILCAA